MKTRRYTGLFFLIAVFFAPNVWADAQVTFDVPTFPSSMHTGDSNNYTYTIHNNTPHPWALITSGISSPVSIASTTCNSNVIPAGPNKSCTVTLTIHPTTTGTISNTITIGYDGRGKNSVTPLNITVTTGHYALASSGSAGTPGLYSCAVTSGTVAALASCTAASLSPAASSPYGVALDTTNNRVYVADNGNSDIYSCASTNGTLGSCTAYTTGTTSFPNAPIGLALDPSLNYLYVTLGTGVSGKVYACPVSSAGVITGTCTNTTASPAFTPIGLTVKTISSTTYGYVTNSAGAPIVTKCTVSSGVWSSCTATGTSLTAPKAIVIDNNNAYAYIANGSGSPLITKCAVSSSDGTFSGCTDSGASGMTGPTALSIDSTNSYLYATSVTDGTIYNCTIGAGGTLSGCTSTGASSFADSLGIASY